MHVGSLCSRDVVTVDANSSVAQAATLMRDRHVGALVVTQEVDGGERVCGIVTDRDLVTRVMVEPDARLLASISTWARRPLVVLAEEDSIDEALHAMRQNGVRRLLVKDGDDRLAGILSVDDVVAMLASQMSDLAGVIQRGMELERGADPSRSDPHRSDMRFPCFGTGTWTPAVNRNERS